MILDSKVDISQVLKDHFKTLRAHPFDGPPSRSELWLHFGLPGLFGLAVVVYGFGFRQDAINGFLNVFAILTGLLLNVLVLVFTLASAGTSKAQDGKVRSLVIRETFVNICFSVVSSLIVVCTCLIASAYMRSVPNATTGKLATFLLVSLTTNFVLTLLMILKRMFILMSGELKNSPEGNSKDKAA